MKLTLQHIPFSTELAPEAIRERALFSREENGVEWWTQRLHPNVHYLIYLGRVYEREGFWSQTFFNFLAHGRAVYNLNSPDYRLQEDQGDYQPWMPPMRRKEPQSY